VLERFPYHLTPGTRHLIFRYTCRSERIITSERCPLYRTG